MARDAETSAPYSPGVTADPAETTAEAVRQAQDAGAEADVEVFQGRALDGAHGHGA